MKCKYVVASVMVGLTASLVEAQENGAKRNAVLEVMATRAPDLLTDDGKMIAEWEEATETPAPVRWRLPDSERARVEVQRVETIAFCDETGRYDLVLDPDGALVLNLVEHFASDTASITVGPVPVVENPDAVQVGALGELAARSGCIGLFDLAPQLLSTEAVSSAIEAYDSAAVYLERGRAVVLFFAGTEVGEVFVFAPEADIAAMEAEVADGGGPRLAVHNYWRVMMVCEVLYRKCTMEENVSACGHWLDHCQDADVPGPD